MVRRAKLKIIWDNEAKRSLRSIYDYLKHKESIRVARKVRDEIVNQTKSLNQFPEKFVQEPLLKNERGNFRYKVIWSYKIIYEITSSSILVIDIFHTSRNPTELRNENDY
jgi:plasmid stabilization system protein ParE